MNPERLLGSLVSGLVNGRTSRRGSRSARRMMRGSGPAIGMGLLGLALGAYEHYSQAQSESAASSGNAAASPPPPPPPPSGAPTADDSLLLIRSMIAAAYADWSMDPEERGRITAEIAKSGASAEEQALLDKELERPQPVESLAEEAKRRGLAEEVYAASIIAIEVDSEAERAYLSRLAAMLGLDPTTVSRWHQELGVR